MRQELYSHFSSQIKLCKDRESFLQRAQKKLMREPEASEQLRRVVTAQEQRNEVERRSYLSKLVRLSEATEQQKLGK